MNDTRGDGERGQRKRISEREVREVKGEERRRISSREGKGVDVGGKRTMKKVMDILRNVPEM